MGTRGCPSIPLELNLVRSFAQIGPELNELIGNRKQIKEKRILKIRNQRMLKYSSFQRDFSTRIRAIYAALHIFHFERYIIFFKPVSTIKQTLFATFKAFTLNQAI